MRRTGTGFRVTLGRHGRPMELCRELWRNAQRSTRNTSLFPAMPRRSTAFRRKSPRGFSPVYRTQPIIPGPEGPRMLPAEGAFSLSALPRISLIRKTGNQEIPVPNAPLPAFLISRLACAGNKSTDPEGGTPTRRFTITDLPVGFWRVGLRPDRMNVAKLRIADSETGVLPPRLP